MHVTKQLKAYDSKEEGKYQESIKSTGADPESFVRGGRLRAKKGPAPPPPP